MRARVRRTVFGKDDSSVNLLDLPAITVTAGAFTERAATISHDPVENILGEARIGLITDVVVSSTSANHLHIHLGERTSRVADNGTGFVRCCGNSRFRSRHIWRSTRCGFSYNTHDGFVKQRVT